MRKIIFFTFAFTLAGFSYSQQHTTNKLTLHKTKDEIVELKDFVALYLEDEDYYGVLPMLLKLDSLEPKNPRHAYLAGIAYLKTNRLIQAVPLIEKAHNHNIKDKDLNFYLGRAKHLSNKFDEAITLYKEHEKSLNKSAIDYEVKKYEIEMLIKQCETGKQLIANPLEIKIENLGQTINTQYPEYVPLIAGDEKNLIFTSRRPTTTGGGKDELDDNFYEDVYISAKENDKWLNPKNISTKINSKHHDACVGISRNGKTLIIYRPDRKAKTEFAGNIYKSELVNNEWTSPVKFEEPINSKYWEPSATISSNDSVIIFSSDRPGGFGGLDLYMCKKQGNGKWGDAVNLGSTVNTPEDDDAPFLHSDDKTLYFSSKGHHNMGGYDIFYTELNSNANTWTQPENIGYPLNSADHDIYFVWNKDASRAYFSTFRNDSYGDKDIYSATRVGRDSSLIVMSGFVLDTITGKSLNASVGIFDLKTGKIVASFISDTTSGKYVATLKTGKNYVVKVVADNYFYKEEIVSVAQKGGYFELKKNFRLKKFQISDKRIASDYKKRLPQTLTKSDLKKLAKELQKADALTTAYQLQKQKSRFKVGDKIIFHNILFDYDKATLNTSSISSLEDVYTILKTYPEIKVEISGHTDSLGSKRHNKKLSSKRASVVVKYLTKRGIPKNRLKAVGEADEEPISNNITEEGRKLNRRTEFKVISIDTTLQDKSLPEFIVPEKPVVKEIPKVEKKKVTLGVLAHFGFNSAFVTEYSKSKMQKVVEAMIENTTMKVKIHAYADPLGKHEVNVELSQKRANAIRDYLVSQGIDANRLLLASEADMRPLINSQDRETNVLNRRVEFEIIEE